MLSWLTKARRRALGRAVALAYAFCVLAPSIAFAFADRQHVAPCLLDEDHASGVVQIRKIAAAHALANHAAQSGHVHSGASSEATSGAGSDQGPRHAHAAPGAFCCGLMSSPALPAGFADVVEPLMQVSSHSSETDHHLVETARAPHYRPPIS